jgi:hypothetical protein
MDMIDEHARKTEMIYSNECDDVQDELSARGLRACIFDGCKQQQQQLVQDGTISHI